MRLSTVIRQCKLTRNLYFNNYSIDTRDLIFYQSVDGAICTDQIYKQVLNKDSVCRCKEKNNLKLRFLLNNSTHCLDCDFNKTVVITLFYRLGLNSPEKGSLRMLNKLVNSSFFGGGFCGKGNQAYFIIGSVGGYYIYMDPHFVQVS